MQHKGVVDPRRLAPSVQEELHEKGFAQRGLLRYLARGRRVYVKRV